MKASSKILVTLASASTLVLATGCVTSDAHDFQTDAGPINTSQQCQGIFGNRCFLVAPIPASGEFLDLSVGTGANFTIDPGTGNPVPPCSQPNSVSSYFGSTGVWVHSGPDQAAGNLNGIQFYPIDDTHLICDLSGTIPGAASWGIYMNPQDTDTCDDGSPKGGLVDASAFDGISITIGGDAGPPGIMTFTVNSVGTPEDPFRLQQLTVDIDIQNVRDQSGQVVPTTYRYLWSELNAKCGEHDWFNPARINGLGGSMIQLAGVAYAFDVRIGKISFFKAQ